MEAGLKDPQNRYRIFRRNGGEVEVGGNNGYSDEDLWSSVARRAKGALYSLGVANSTGRQGAPVDEVRVDMQRPAELEQNPTPEIQPVAPSIHESNEGSSDDSPDSEMFVAISKNPRERLRKALLEYYRLLELLKNFRIINQTAVVKILKKFEKATSISGGVFLERAKHYGIFGGDDKGKIEELLAQTEQLFTDTISDGSRQDARRQLRVPDFKSKSYEFTSWRTGLMVGLSLPAIALALRAAFTAPHTNGIELVLQIYGGYSIPIFFLFYASMLLIIWERYHVNYVLVFELDPRDFLAPEGFAELAGLLLLIFSYNMYLAFADNFLAFIPNRYYPLILLGIILGLIILPFNLFYRSARLWILRTIGRIVLSGVFPVQFRDFFITDIISSMTYTFSTLALLACGSFHDFNDLNAHCEFSGSWLVPVFTALPAWWRLLQCFRRFYDNRLFHPHLTNSLKYILSLSVIFLSAASRILDSDTWRALWICKPELFVFRAFAVAPQGMLTDESSLSLLPIFFLGTGFAVIASCYSYSWDVLFDWGLFQKNPNHK
ncbi:hypothetical protein HK104_008821 [Borealophlyctis nickersoniae]|nr:hypothetical protein HK104_008821 [Borealophlyctis nickersoniae]